MAGRRSSNRWLPLLGLVGVLAMFIAIFVYQNVGKQNELVLGAALPLTGQYAQYGIVPRNAIDLAIEERTAGGYPYKVTIQYEDTQLRPELALTAVRKLIDVHHVPLIFGAAGSNETAVIGPVAQKDHVVLISPASTAASLSHIGDYFFRTIPSDTYEGEYMARFVYGRGVTRIGIFAVNDTGTKSLADAFRAEFVRLGGKVASYVLAPKDASDLRTQITALRSASPQAIYLVGYATETGVFLKQQAELSLGLPLYSAHPAEASEVRTIAGQAADGLIFSTPGASGDANIRARFVDAYRKRYGQDPGEFAAEAYDAAMLALDAIQRVGPSAPAIRDYLHAVHGYDGVSGKITFSKTGDVEKPVQLMIIRNGRSETFPVGMH